MIQVFRIKNASDAPRMRLANPAEFDPSFMRFDGREKGHYSRRKAFAVVADPSPQKLQFYNFAPGVLAGPVAALNECRDMFYATVGTERLSLLAGTVAFTAINPLEAVDPSPDEDAPCRVDRFYAPIFRVKGRDPLELYCVSGFDVPLDEFRYVYDLHGFAGLEFEEIWRSG